MPHSADNPLIERLCRLAQGGDQTAERQLFQILTDSFRVIAQHRVRNQAVALDLAQDALTVVAEKYKQTEFVSSFAGWAHNVLRNTIMSHTRTEATHTRLQNVVQSTVPSISPNGQDDELRRLVLHCLKQVARANRRFARALNLHQQGFSMDEISARLKMKIPYLYVVMSRARSMLVTCLGMTAD